MDCQFVDIGTWDSSTTMREEPGESSMQEEEKREGIEPEREARTREMGEKGYEG